VHTHVHAKPKIALFHRKYPGAARHINAAIFDSIPFTKSIQSIENLNDKRTINKETQFEVDSIENVYHLYL
jgi:hypothetical protein